MAKKRKAKPRPCKLLLSLALTGLVLCIIGCTGVSPEELAMFRQKTAIVKEMSIRCEVDATLCCPALKEAARAMETITLACGD
jgi:trimethylamine:corrinoid methyltransferase-like protein